MPTSYEFNGADIQKIADLYCEGVAPSIIGKLFGCSNTPIIRILRECGIEVRSKCEAFAAIGEEKRMAMTAAAHAAKRGKPMKDDSKLRLAATVEAAGLLNFANGTLPVLEDRFIRWLVETDSNMAFTPQKAVGFYNVDIALTTNRVAVEIFGGGWHSTGRHAIRYRKRIEYLLSQSWTPLIVWATSRYPLTQSAVDYAVTLHNVLGTQQPTTREEHVIWGTGELIPVDQRDPVTGARIKRFEGTYRPRDDHGRFGK